MKALRLKAGAMSGPIAFLAVAAFALLAPSTASAGCSHDGLSRGWRSDGAAHFQYLASSGAMSLPDGTSVAIPENPDRPQHRPCSGPTCSENPSAPTAPVGVAPTPSSTQWVCLLDLLSVDVQAWQAHAVNASLEKSLVMGNDVFHPPRWV